MVVLARLYRLCADTTALHYSRYKCSRYSDMPPSFSFSFIELSFTSQALLFVPWRERLEKGLRTEKHMDMQMRTNRNACAVSGL